MAPKCNQCDSVTINGVYCHERGCPNTNKFWDEHNQEWVTEEEIFDDFEPEWIEEYFLDEEGE